MKISLITATGDRPEAFRLCEKYMQRQTRMWDEWIVVDDGWAPIEADICSATRVIRPRRLWERGQNTLARNLLIGLAASTGDAIAFIEDDDWYSPDYLNYLIRAIEYGADIVGEGSSVYYHVPSRQSLLCGNTSHASLCQTIINRRIAPMFADLLQYNCEGFHDVSLWRMATEARNGFVPIVYPFNSLCVGIKGMPGRKGIGSGHRPNAEFWQQDNEQANYLQELIGVDAANYLPYMEEHEV